MGRKRKQGYAGKAQKRTEKTKLHGVITEQMVPEQVERSGLYPFTFSSAAILMGCALIGGILIPWQAQGIGVSVDLAMLVALPPLLAFGLSISRYFVDSQRGLCRGFWSMFAVTWAVSALILYLMLFCGILLT